MKFCLLCDKKLYIVKFKSVDGYICKICYQHASHDFSQIIKDKNKNELIDACKIYNLNIKEHDFETTRKVNQIILFDDINLQFCLPNHLKFANKKKQPEIFPYHSLVDFQIIEQTQNVAVKNGEEVFGTIQIVFTTNHRTLKKSEVWLICQPINIESTAYRIMYRLAQKIKQEINELNNIKRFNYDEAR